MKPLAIEAMYALGMWLLDGARDEDAAEPFRALVLTAPEDPRGWLGLGVVHERRGRTAAALVVYETGALASQSARCHVARARLYAAIGDDEAAADALDAAKSVAGDDDEVLAWIARERCAA